MRSFSFKETSMMSDLTHLLTSHWPELNHRVTGS